MSPGCGQRVMELIIRIIHLIHTEYSFEASFIESGIMGDKRHAFINHRFNLCPHFREDRCPFDIFWSQPMHSSTEPLTVIRFRIYQAVERVDNLSFHDFHHAHGADARGLLVECFEIYAETAERHGHLLISVTRGASCRGL